MPPLKMLICAPSNAAIDEVAKRLKDGVRDSLGRLVVPNIVRVGAEQVVNISVKDIFLDQLVDQRLNSDPSQTSASFASTTMTSLRAEMDALRNIRTLKMQEMTNLHDNPFGLQALELELKSLNNKRISLSQQLNRIKDQQKSDSRTLDAARRKYRAEVLTNADIICSTLSGAGHEVLENLNFEIIVIDEAAQSVELSSLIPLKYRSKRCIMVGGARHSLLSAWLMLICIIDPQQLPPTVLSPLADKFGYGQSLFVRLQKSRPDAVHLLRYVFILDSPIAVV
jgi:ATP-dependent RNA/DNA helicase, senataxin